MNQRLSISYDVFNVLFVYIDTKVYVRVVGVLICIYVENCTIEFDKNFRNQYLVCLVSESEKTSDGSIQKTSLYYDRICDWSIKYLITKYQIRQLYLLYTVSLMYICASTESYISNST